MKKLMLIALFIASIHSQAQNIDKITKPIVEEGKKLYKLEMASWHGTDIFLAEYKNKDNISGYFSYIQGNECINVFFSKGDRPKIISTITFDDTFDLNKAKIQISEREFTKAEKEIYELRQNALKIVKTDTLFKFYNNTNYNIIPIIEKKENKVYVLTATQHKNVIIFGNDYLMVFDKKNQLKSAKAIHQNIIPIEYNPESNVVSSVHSHLPETGEFITATDICTLMLYGKATGWKNYYVASENYLNVWNISSDELFVMTMDAVRKINENKDSESNNEEIE